MGTRRRASGRLPCHQRVPARGSHAAGPQPARRLGRSLDTSAACEPRIRRAPGPYRSRRGHRGAGRRALDALRPARDSAASRRHGVTRCAGSRSLTPLSARARLEGERGRTAGPAAPGRGLRHPGGRASTHSATRLLANDRRDGDRTRDLPRSQGRCAGGHRSARCRRVHRRASHGTTRIHGHRQPERNRAADVLPGGPQPGVRAGPHRARRCDDAR